MTKRSSKPATATAQPTATTMGPADVAETIVALAIQARVPVIIKSEPGAGKSSMVKAMSEDLGERLHTIMLSVREPTDQGGLPAVFEERGEKLVRIIPPGWARDLIRDKQGLVFFDEVSNATPAVMNSALRIVQEGVVGDGERLPEKTGFVLAMNPPETNIGANDITAGIANRCVHVRWPFDYNRWRTGMLSGWARTPGRVPRLSKSWEDRVPEMVAIIIGFLDTRTELAQKQPADVAAQAGPWPSARTWDLTSRMLAAAADVGHGVGSIVASTIVSGLVGPSVMTEWSSWIANLDLPKTEDVMRNPSSFAFPKRQDQILAVLAGVVGFVARHPGNVEHYMSAWTVTIRTLKLDPSLAIRTSRDLGKLMPPGADKMNGTPFHEGIRLVKDHLRGAQVDYGSTP